MNINPKYVFYVALALAITGVGSDAAIWKNALPDTWITHVAAWNNLFTKVGLALMTVLTGMNATKSSQIANVAAMPDVKKVVAVNEIANNPTFVDNAKVTSS